MVPVAQTALCPCLCVSKLLSSSWKPISPTLSPHLHVWGQCCTPHDGWGCGGGGWNTCPLSFLALCLGLLCVWLITHVQSVVSEPHFALTGEDSCPPKSELLLKAANELSLPMNQLIYLAQIFYLLNEVYPGSTDPKIPSVPCRVALLTLRCSEARLCLCPMRCSVHRDAARWGRLGEGDGGTGK